MNIKKTNLLFITIAILITLSGWIPFIIHINDIGIQDQGFFLQQYEGIRKTIIEYGQFPYWHPWHTGGTPLFARPDIGLFSIESLFAILFGTVKGLNIAILAYLIIGVSGMFMLIKDYTSNWIIMIWGSVLFGLQSTATLHIGTAGHIAMLPYVWFPWIVFLGKRIPNSLKSSIILGIILSLIINSSIYYISIFNFILLAFVLIYEFLKNIRNRFYYYNIVVMSLLFLTLSIYKIMLSLEVILQFPREISTHISIPLYTFLKALIIPFHNIYTITVAPYWRWHEVGCYIGLLALLMFIFSMIKKIRWWHICAIITVSLAINSTSKYLPGYWIRELPGFKTMWVITRWRFLSVFFIILGSVQGCKIILEKSNMQKYKNYLYLLIALSTILILSNQYHIWNQNKWISKEETIKLLRLKSDSIINSSAKVPMHCYYATTFNGIGLLNSYENMLGYSGYTENYDTRRIPIEDRKNYKGEVYALDRTPIKYQWTPNKILINTSNKTKVVINQNPGNQWFLNGQQLFPELKSFDQSKNFIISLPKKGIYLLEIKPPLNDIILTINLIIFILLIISLLLYYKRLHIN